MNINSILNLLSKTPLTAAETEEIFWDLLNEDFGKNSRSYLAAFLMAMQSRGPTFDELVGLMKAVEQDRVDVPVVDNVCGLVGNGRDDFKTVNISTGAGLIAAAVGMRVGKNGCRAESSKTGTTDVLETLGANVHCDISHSIKSLRKNKFALFDAQQYFPRMYRMYVGNVTWRNPLSLVLAVATPIPFRSMVFGMSDPTFGNGLTPKILKKIGPKNILVVCGKMNGFIDELSISGKSYVYEIKPNKSKTYPIIPKYFGLSTFTPDHLKQKDSHRENAMALLEGITGSNTAISQCFALNAGAALYIGGKAKTIKEGVDLALDAVKSGTPLEVLERYITATGGSPKKFMKDYS
jgi:anthranilate phosphoribosyltransferase